MLAKREFWMMLLFSSTTRCNRAGAVGAGATGDFIFNYQIHIPKY
jgi:hypothetical protein